MFPPPPLLAGLFQRRKPLPTSPDYMSPDVIDRRDGQAQTFGDKARDIYIKVLDDYQSTIGSNPNATPMPGLDGPGKYSHSIPPPAMPNKKFTGK